MQYIVHSRYQGKTLNGRLVNLPFGTLCRQIGDHIYFGDIWVTTVTSATAHEHFARDDDGRGAERGKLTQEIMRLLRNDPRAPRQKAEKQERAWKKIWDDPNLMKYKRIEAADFWYWNHAFFNAEIEDLKYILKIVKEA